MCQDLEVHAPLCYSYQPPLAKHTVIINDSSCGRVSISSEPSSLSIVVLDGGSEGENLILLKTKIRDKRDVTKC